jgi:hypothetical protein
MAIVSASLRSLACTQPINGVQYLWVDLRVECNTGQHAVTRVLACVVLVVVGVGFPVVLGSMMATTTLHRLKAKSFRSGWGFLYDGYKGAQPAPGARTSLLVQSIEKGLRMKRSSAIRSHISVSSAVKESPPPVMSAVTASTPMALLAEESDAASCWNRCNCTEMLVRRLKSGTTGFVWWEAVVLLRKAALVLLAVLVTDPFNQSVGCTLVLGTALYAQTVYRPYESPLMNALESLTLAAASITSCVSVVLLAYDVGSADFAGQVAANMTLSQWSATVLLGILNFGTLLVLAVCWCRLHAAKLRQRGLFRLPRFSADVGSSKRSLTSSSPTSVQQPAHIAATAQRSAEGEPTNDVANPLHAARVLPGAQTCDLEDSHQPSRDSRASAQLTVPSSNSAPHRVSLVPVAAQATETSDRARFVPIGRPMRNGRSFVTQDQPPARSSPA